VNVTTLRFAVVLGGLALPSAARAQAERLAGRLDESTRSAVTAIVDSMRRAGVPATPLVNKALEGASKGADGARIVAAVRALAGDLGRARAALGREAAEPELVAGAAALRAGAAPAFLEQLRGNYPKESLVVPLAVMADLVTRGVPADTATRSVLALMREGVRDADLVAFRQSVERDIALGAPAGGAASTLASPASGGNVPGNASLPPPPRPRKP
jgi:hypothetical protein